MASFLLTFGVVLLVTAMVLRIDDAGTFRDRA